MKKLIVIALIIVAAWYFLTKGKSTTQKPVVDPGPTNQITDPIEQAKAIVNQVAQKIEKSDIKKVAEQITPELVNKVVEQTQEVEKTIQEIVKKQSAPVLRTEQLTADVMPSRTVVSAPVAPKPVITSPVPILKPLPITRPISDVITDTSSTRKMREL